MNGFNRLVPQIITRVRSMRIVVTLQIVANVFHVSRVDFPNYPGCECLRTMSKDELKSTFCERLSEWGDR